MKITNKLSDKIIFNENVDKDKIYFITPASSEEIQREEYIEVEGVKISANPKRHAVITGVKND